MKTVFLVLAAMTLAACASHNSNVVSTDTSALRVGEKPQGYPRTYVVANAGNCTRVTEDWRDNGSSNGKQMWALDKHIETVTCQ
jgi:hypothetical protein